MKKMKYLGKNPEITSCGSPPSVPVAAVLRRQLYRASPFVAMLTAWQLAAYFSGWSPQVFPGPFAVADGMWELLENGTLLRHAVASLFRVTVGFYLAILAGIPLGILLGRWKPAALFLNPAVQFLRPISPLAWIPLAMLWFGIGDPPAIFLIFLASFFPLTVSTAASAGAIRPVYFHVGANFSFSRFEILTRIVMPAMLPDILTALRISVTIAWLVVVAAEMIAVTSGLGFLILDARNGLRMDYVMAGMIVIGMIGMCLDGLMMRLSSCESVFWGTLSK
jgi:NitT/TauT family transport system permease protein